MIFPSWFFDRPSLCHLRLVLKINLKVMASAVLRLRQPFVLVILWRTVANSSAWPLDLQCLVAIMDWATRHVLAWRLSNTMDACFCVEALTEALARYSAPAIFNTDQGSQFTSFDFTGVLKDVGVTISMDGRGRCMDNIFIERLWRSLKYEAIYLHELSDGFKAERVIAEWIDFYNTERPHSSLGGRTPAEAYGAGQPVDMMDKPDGLLTSLQAQQQQEVMINRIQAA